MYFYDPGQSGGIEAERMEKGSTGIDTFTEFGKKCYIFYRNFQKLFQVQTGGAIL